MAKLISKAFRDLMARHTSEDGGVNFFDMISEVDKGTGTGLQSTVNKMFELGKEGYQEFSRAYPILDEIGRYEFENLYIVSMPAIPYQFALDNLVIKGDMKCSDETPLMCLPTEVLGYFYMWKHVGLFVASLFVTILGAAILGALVSQRRFNVGVVRGSLRLLACLLIDLLSLLSLGVPVVGYLIDIAWAPIAGLLVAILTGSTKYGGLVCLKEAMPFIDFIPLATILGLRSLME